MLTEQEKIQLANLKAKRDKQPTSTKVSVWNSEIERLNAKRREVARTPLNSRDNTQSRRQPSVRRMEPNMSNTNVDIEQAKSAASEINESMSDSLASTLNPDVGAFRLPDSVNVQTALYHSIYQTNVYVDPSITAGQFQILVQPKLGSLQKTSNYFVAMAGQNTTNFSSPAAFLSDNEGTDPRLDSELDFFLRCGLSQNTLSGEFALSTTGISGSTFPSSTSHSGTNNSDYAYYPAGVLEPSLGYAPQFGAYIVPEGTYYHNIQITGFSNFQWFNDAQKYTMAATGGTICLVVFLMEYKDGVESELTRFRVDYNPITQNISILNPADPQYLLYVRGSVGGVANTLGSSSNMTASIQFYTNYEIGFDKLRYLAIEVEEFPEVTSPSTPKLQFVWDTTTTTLGGEDLLCPTALLKRIRPTSQKVHFACTLSEFNNSGEIALNLMPGASQLQQFSVQGGNLSTFTSLSNFNLPLRQYSGKLETGAYGFWVPDNVLDVQLRDYNDHVNYQYPYFALAGNWTPSGGTGGGLQKIGILRIVTNYEYTTTSKIVETKAQPGTDNLCDVLRSTFSQVPKVMENPSHSSVLAKIARGAVSTAKAIEMVGKTAITFSNGALNLLNAIPGL